MKILVVSHEYPPIGGGGANACLFLTKGYAEAGHKVTLITVWYEGLQEYEIVNGVEIFRVKSRRAHKEHCGFQEMFSYLVRALPLADRLEKKQRFDICQVFFGIPSGPIGWWLKKKYKLPYIIRFGGGDIPGFQDRFKLLYKALNPAVKALWRNADALVANSGGLRDFALRFYDKKPIDIIYNGVDTDCFYPDHAKRDSQIWNFLFVSRLIERKGLQHIIPQLKAVQAVSDREIRLTIVGDGPYRSTLEELTRQHGVENMVSFEGQKDKNELLPYYQAGHVFLFPSKREGMPNAVLEAMACGLPVVMTPCEGSGELIDGNGVVTETDGFAKAMTKCLQQETAFSGRSRELACSRFSWDTAAMSYLAIMESICQRQYTAERYQEIARPTDNIS